MDLSTIDFDFAVNWLQQNLLAQPKNCKSLTWYVGANHLYMNYANVAMHSERVPVSFVELWKAMQIGVPEAKPGKLAGKIPVYFRCRFMKDGLPDFGV